MNTENLNNTIDQILGFITNQVSYVIDTTSGGLKNISQGAAAGKEWNWNFSDNSLLAGTLANLSGKDLFKL